ncbi:MAG: hypothetical protein ACPGRD_06000, partial [Planktomarina sp.]
MTTKPKANKFRVRNQDAKAAAPKSGGFQLPVVDDAMYESKRKQNHTDFALRWSHYIGVFDFGLSHFSGTDRQPMFVPVYAEGSDTAEPAVNSGSGGLGNENNSDI